MGQKIVREFVTYCMRKLPRNFSKSLLRLAFDGLKIIRAVSEFKRGGSKIRARQFCRVPQPRGAPGAPRGSHAAPHGLYLALMRHHVATPLPNVQQMSHTPPTSWAPATSRRATERPGGATWGYLARKGRGGRSIFPPDLLGVTGQIQFILHCICPKRG